MDGRCDLRIRRHRHAGSERAQRRPRQAGRTLRNYAPGRLNADVFAFYSGNDNETRRNVLVGGTSQQARADFENDSYGIGARVGYRLTSDAGPLVRTFVEALYAHLDSAE